MKYLSPESRLAALLCVPLSSSEFPPNEFARPLSPKQWFIFNERLKSAGGHDGACPSDGLDLNNIEQADVSVLAQVLNLPENDAIQIRKRLDLAEAVEAELERLQELGIWTITIADTDYPNRLRETLPIQAPPILFGIGRLEALDRGGLAVVGSRRASDIDLQFAHTVGKHCAGEGIQVISGGAKGIDQFAMIGALEQGGNTLGVLGDSLEKQSANSETQPHIESGQLILISPYHPASHFEVGKAMGRNKLIYALADWALVVSCQVGQGGTWNGAIAAIRSLKTPVFVRIDTEISVGNQELIRRGALEFPQPPWEGLGETLKLLSVEYRPKNSIPISQSGLFDNSEE
jgi:predicted Rossmann fold nucleotide-binding protein DprA/Smf involved in DNA uptake